MFSQVLGHYMPLGMISTNQYIAHTRVMTIHDLCKVYMFCSPGKNFLILFIPHSYVLQNNLQTLFMF